MTTLKFNWKIISTDQANGTMVVSYEHKDDPEQRLNIPQPPAGESVADHIAKFAPVSSWQLDPSQFEPVKKGQQGTGVIEQVESEPLPAELPNLIGNWNEEYMRAMIYQVLEEIKESQA